MHLKNVSLKKGHCVFIASRDGDAEKDEKLRLKVGPPSLDNACQGMLRAPPLGNDEQESPPDVRGNS